VLNTQLDLALREKHDSTEVPFQFAAMQALVGNINSLLTRYHHGELDQGAQSSGGGLQPQEIENLIHFMGYPALAISSQEVILSVNSGFAQICHANADQIQGQRIETISDMALQQNIKNLMSLSANSPHQIHADHLEIGGHNFKLLGQSIGSISAGLNYYIVAVVPAEGGAYGSAS